MEIYGSVSKAGEFGLRMKSHRIKCHLGWNVKWSSSFKDWSTTVGEEPLMMEAFGPCLPSKRQGDVFMSKVETEASGE